MCFLWCALIPANQTMRDSLFTRNHFKINVLRDEIVNMALTLWTQKPENAKYVWNLLIVKIHFSKIKQDFWLRGVLDDQHTSLPIIVDGAGLCCQLLPALQLQVLVLHSDLSERLVDVHRRLPGAVTGRVPLPPVVLVQGTCVRDGVWTTSVFQELLTWKCRSRLKICFIWCHEGIWFK